MNRRKTEHELIERDAKRDVWQEALDGIRDIKAKRSGRRFTMDSYPIVRTREKSGLSQAEFAKLLGISKRTLQEWEQGRKQPSGAARALLKIAAQYPELVRKTLAA